MCNFLIRIEDDIGVFFTVPVGDYVDMNKAAASCIEVLIDWLEDPEHLTYSRPEVMRAVKQLTTLRSSIQMSSEIIQDGWLDVLGFTGRVIDLNG